MMRPQVTLCRAPAPPDPGPRTPDVDVCLVTPAGYQTDIHVRPATARGY